MEHRRINDLLHLAAPAFELSSLQLGFFELDLLDSNTSFGDKELAAPHGELGFGNPGGFPQLAAGVVFDLRDISPAR
jgi:hypothetical protein